MISPKWSTSRKVVRVAPLRGPTRLFVLRTAIDVLLIMPPITVASWALTELSPAPLSMRLCKFFRIDITCRFSVCSATAVWNHKGKIRFFRKLGGRFWGKLTSLRAERNTSLMLATEASTWTSPLWTSSFPYNPTATDPLKLQIKQKSQKDDIFWNILSKVLAAKFSIARNFCLELFIFSLGCCHLPFLNFVTTTI